ncbi:hypothetical protein SCLCIDRAFT_1211753, partial [Scleroderma citrinum Foug A]
PDCEPSRQLNESRPTDVTLLWKVGAMLPQHGTVAFPIAQVQGSRSTSRPGVICLSLRPPTLMWAQSP